MKKVFILMISFSVVLSILPVNTISFEQSHPGESGAGQQTDLRVRNLDTGRIYLTIQEAIDAQETSNGDEILVASGIYYEHVFVSKSLSLIGEERSTTIIDGNGKGSAVYVSAGNTEIRNLSIRNGVFGLWLDNSRNSRIVGNVLQDCTYGMRIYNSPDSEVIGNSVYGSVWFGVEIKSSENSTLRNNSLVDNRYGFGVNGNSLSDFINDIDVSNTVNGKPIYYLINQHDATIESLEEIGYLGLVNSTNIKIVDLNVQNNVQGILFAFGMNSTITNVKAESNWNGIYVAHSSNVSVSGCDSNGNFDYGIKFFSSSHSVARTNNVDDNGWAGIGLFGSPNSTVDRNEASFNTYNLHLVYTNNSVITANNALAEPGGYSVAVYYSHNNLIYHNTFTSSLLYAETRNWTRFFPRNDWDNGLEGNYWNLYRGSDSDHDGLGDVPYVVEENNVDNHPLMGRFSYYTLVWRGRTYLVTIVSNSTIPEFQFIPQEGNVRFAAVGDNGTMGFSRIGVPNELLQDLQSENLSFSINEEQKTWERKFTDGVYTYFYFSHVNRVSDSLISPWAIVALAFMFIGISMLVFWILKKKLLELCRSFLERTIGARGTHIRMFGEAILIACFWLNNTSSIGTQKSFSWH